MSTHDELSKQALKWIKQYSLIQHVEGGYFAETLMDPSLQDHKNIQQRALYTSILFLLCGTEVSHFHQLKSDELWYFHQGDPLDIVCIGLDDKLSIHHLGNQADQVLQVLVEKGSIFGSYVPNHGTALVGCAVIPGFLYTEFKLFTKAELLAKVPQHQTYINLLGG
ncbi:MAG: cupin domain-containing protein [Erysipelotrichaceae bacterium]